jgi:L-fucose mutarotase
LHRARPLKQRGTAASSSMAKERIEFETNKGVEMINGSVTHPDVLRALACSGHSGKVVVVDAHFPLSTGVAASVFLNYAPGLLTIADVLRPLVNATPIESAVGAIHDDDRLPDIWSDYVKILPAHVKLTQVRMSNFGPILSDPKVALLIATAEMRTNACIVLTLGIRSH